MTTEGLTRPIARWPIPDSLRNDPMVTQAENLVKKYAKSDLNTILDVYVAYHSPEAVQRDFKNLFDNLKPFELRGKGMEIGAGVAVFSSMICDRYPNVEKVYAIEVVAGVVEHLRPRILDHFIPDKVERVANVIGSFDDIDLEDGSCDFCVENSSLHHSYDLVNTMQEINRKLRQGGHLLIIDRAHNDCLSEEQRDIMLDLVYSKNVMEKNGFIGESLTRRQNGEHEIKLGEWTAAIAAGGFEVEQHVELRTHGFKKLIRALMLKIPFSIRKVLDIHPTRVSGHPGELWWLVRALFGAAEDRMYRKGFRDYSVFLAKKVSEVPPRTTPLGGEEPRE